MYSHSYSLMPFPAFAMTTGETEILLIHVLKSLFIATFRSPGQHIYMHFT